MRDGRRSRRGSADRQPGTPAGGAQWSPVVEREPALPLEPLRGRMPGRGAHGQQHGRDGRSEQVRPAPQGIGTDHVSAVDRVGQRAAIARDAPDRHRQRSRIERPATGGEHPIGDRRDRLVRRVVQRLPSQPPGERLLRCHPHRELPSPALTLPAWPERFASRKIAPLGGQLKTPWGSTRFRTATICR